MRSTRHLRRLAAALTSTALAAGLVAVAAPVAHAGSGCEADCIENVSLSVGPDRITVGFGTTVLAHSTLTLTAAGKPTRRLDRPGSYYQWTGEFDTLASGALAQGTTYAWTITATDQDGRTWAESGTATTRTRSASIAWSTSTITDDSDPAGSAYITGASRANTNCPITALAPLSMTIGTVRDTGQTMTHKAAGTLACTQVPATFSVYTLLVDDDSEFAPLYCAQLPVVNFFTPAGMLTSDHDICHEWTSGSASVTSPLDGWSTGTASTPVAISASAAASKLAYTASGTATFTVAGGGWTGPKPGAPVTLAATATSSPGSVHVAWSPAPDLFPLAPASYLVSHRAQGDLAWTTVTTTGTSRTIDGLTNGTWYDVRVEARDGMGRSWVATSLTARPRAASTVTGFAGSAVAAAGGSVLKQVAVSATGSPREGVLVGRRKGTSSYAVVRAFLTDGAGKAVVALPVRTGIWEYRLGFDDAGAYAGVESPVVTVSSSSRVTGFAGPRKTLKRGTRLALTATVAPGAGRKAVLQFRKAGTTTWTTRASYTASSTGRIALSLKAVKGTRHWRLVVPASNALGAAVVSGTRTIRGR